MKNLIVSNCTLDITVENYIKTKDRFDEVKAEYK